MNEYISLESAIAETRKPRLTDAELRRRLALIPKADAIEKLQERVKTLTRELDEANQDADYANEAATALHKED